jgi:aminomethyltransferase
MKKQTPLYQQHIDAGAKMVDFGDWSMPLHYGSQLKEHHYVREHAGIFDVSHMTILDIKGNDVQTYLKTLLANDISKITQLPGKALYSCMLNHSGGVIDDLIIYYMNDNWFRLIVNSSTREKDLHWFKEQIKDQDVLLTEHTDLAMIAVQGPDAIAITNKTLAFQVPLKPFTAIEKDNLFIARTGYTGEDGYEIIIPNDQASSLWKQLVNNGVKPCGLGARDTLRLEAGMNLYGNDMDETTSPLERGLSWTIDFTNQERNFIGRQALEEQKNAGLNKKWVGLVLQGKGIMRSHQKLIDPGNDSLTGKVTSGGFSPTLEKSIAFASIPIQWEESCSVEIRKKQVPAKIVKLPFVRKGKIINN